MLNKATVLLLCCMWAANVGFGQLFVNNGEAITVESGVTLTINGDFTNQTSGSSLGAINNAGIISVTGNWTNNAANSVFSSSAGIVELIATNAQTVGGTNTTAFHVLRISNTAATSPQIILAQSVNVNNTLQMIQGNLNLAGYTITLGTAAANPGTLVHSESSASGWMYGGRFQRYFNNTAVPNNSIQGLFPLGTATNHYRPLYISAPTVAPTTGGTIAVQHFDATTVSNTMISDGSQTIVRRHDALWGISSGGVSGGTYNLTARGTGFGTVGDVGDIRLATSSGVVGSHGTNGGTTANPFVTRTGLTVGNLSGNFHFGSINGGATPLPIELISFYGVCEAEGNTLYWSTASEINNDYFSLERSDDGLEFVQIAEVPGAGNSLELINYDQFDKRRTAETAYYRLKQTDFNGEYEYSEIIAVHCKADDEWKVTIYPNPNNGKFFVNSSEPWSELKVLNHLGQNVEYFRNSEAPNHLNVESLPPGSYWLEITSESNIVVRKSFQILR